METTIARETRSRGLGQTGERTERTGERTGEAWLKGIFCALVSGLLLWYPICLFTFEGSVTPVWIEVLRLVAVALGIWLGKGWKDKGFWILVTILGLQFLRVFIPNAGDIFQYSFVERFFHGIWGFGACYMLGRVLGEKELKLFLKIFLAAWTAIMAVHTGLALVAAWRDEVIWTPKETSFWGLGTTYGSGEFTFIRENAARMYDSPLRLYMVHYSTVAGAMLSLSAMMAVLGILLHRNVVVKILYGIAFAGMLTALALTDSRAAHFGLAAGIGILLGAAVLWAFGRKAGGKHRAADEKAEKKRKALAWACAIAVVIAGFIGGVLLCRGTIQGFNALKADGGVLMPRAFAEEAEKAKTVVSNRGFDGLSSLSDRPQVWENVLDYIWNHPMVLLIGESVLNPMAGPNAWPKAPYMVAHCHCAPLEILLESGIPGLLLAAGFLVYAAVACWRLVTAKEKPMWQRAIPAVIVCVLVGELAECIAWMMGYGCANFSLLMMFIGIACGLGANHQKMSPASTTRRVRKATARIRGSISEA